MRHAQLTFRLLVEIRESARSLIARRYAVRDVVESILAGVDLLVAADLADAPEVLHELEAVLTKLRSADRVIDAAAIDPCFRRLVAASVELDAIWRRLVD